MVMRIVMLTAAIVLLALIGWALTSCEPCAVVLTGHCEERQHDEDKPAIYEPPGVQPEPLYVPPGRVRG